MRRFRSKVMTVVYSVKQEDFFYFGQLTSHLQLGFFNEV